MKLCVTENNDEWCLHVAMWLFAWIHLNVKLHLWHLWSFFLSGHVLENVTCFFFFLLSPVQSGIATSKAPPLPSAPSFLLFPNALLWSDDAPSVICEQSESMLCSSQLLNSPHASSGGTGGGAGGWQSVRSINMKYSALNIHIIYCCCRCPC